VSSTPVALANFGVAVAIEGDAIVVGAPYESGPGLSTSGYVYVFRRSGTTWTQQARIAAIDATSGASFGMSVALSGSTLAIGAPLTMAGNGAAHIYRYQLELGDACVADTDCRSAHCVDSTCCGLDQIG
jgi:hypothetical protein